MLRTLLKITLALALAAPLVLYAIAHRGNPSDGKVHIHYVCWGSVEQMDTEKAIVARFEKLHPEIKVDLLVMPYNTYNQTMEIMLASGTEPDVFRVDMWVLPSYVKFRAFSPLNDLIARDPSFHLDDYFPQAIDEVTFDGKIYGLSVLFGGRVIYYNKDLFRQANLPDPYEQFQRGEWTYDNFVKSAQALTKFDPHTGLATQFGCLLDPEDIWSFVWGHGGDILTPGGKVTIDTPATIEGLHFYYNLINVWHVSPQPAESANAAFSFPSGNVGMYTNYVGTANQFRQSCHGFDWDVVPMPGPMGQRHPTLKGNGLVMSAHTKQRAAAWEFMKFMVSPRAERIYCGDALRRAIPTLKSVAASPEFRIAHQEPYNIGTFEDLYKTGRELPITDRWMEWQRPFVRWLDRLALATCTPQEAAAGMQKDVEEVLEQNE